MSFSAYGVFPATPSLRWPPDGPLQQPGSFLEYGYVASAETQYGTDPIVSATLAVSPSGAGEMTPSELLVDGYIITVWMLGGVAGRKHLVKLTLTLLSDTVFEIPIAMRIDTPFGPQPPPPPPSPDFGTPITWHASGPLDFSDPNNSALIALF